MRAGFCVLLYLLGYIAQNKKAPALGWGSGSLVVIESFMCVIDYIGAG